ncbi:MAG: hypothetical protein AAB036_04845 [Elusimicrobiota bacterium]
MGIQPYRRSKSGYKPSDLLTTSCTSATLVIPSPFKSVTLPACIVNVKAEVLEILAPAAVTVSPAVSMAAEAEAESVKVAEQLGVQDAG